MAVKDELRREFAKRLTDVLYEKGWNQSDLARKLWGQTKSGTARGRDNVSTWANAHSFPSSKHMKLLCKVLNVEPEDLIPGGMRAAQASVPTPLKLTATDDGMARIEVNEEVPMDVAIKVFELVRKSKQ